MVLRFGALSGTQGLELGEVLRFRSLEWHSGLGAWSCTHVSELGVVLGVGALSGTQGLELGAVLISWSLE